MNRRDTGSRACRHDPQTGTFLLELIMAISLLTVGVLGFLHSFQSYARATSDMLARDRASTMVHNSLRLLQSADFASVRETYDGKLLPLEEILHALSGLVDLGGLLGDDEEPESVDLGELLAPDGEVAGVQVDFFVNELSLPPEFGPILDLDGDGTLATADCSATYLILPTRLRLTYQTLAGPVTEEVFVVLRDDEP